MGDSNSEIKITFETLFELLRREKNRDDLQKLSPGFYNDVASYLKQKQEADASKLDAYSDDLKRKQQIESTKKIIKELYERRERKIINLALLKSRNPNLNFSEAMLEEEMGLFNKLVDDLQHNRDNLLLDIIESKTPRSIEPFAAPEPEESESEKKETKSIRFLHAVPRFYGRNMEIYGPYEAEDIANLPSELADVLVLKKRADEIEEQS